MKYLCLIYADEAIWPSLPKSEEEKMMLEYRAFGEGAKASGHLIAGHRLHNVDSATTIRIRNGKMSTTDGPFAETKEQLGGFYMLEAKDLNDAISVASKIPGAKHGSIEVRPVWEMAAAAASKAG